MGNKIFERRTKSDKPVLAICYDFDKTLSPDDMQAQGYIQSVGYDIADFWRESNELAEDNDMDTNLAYMYKMIEKAEGRMVVTREKLAEYGSKVELFPGVRTWFERIRRYGAEHGVTVEHYIISSGLKEMIEGTEMFTDGEEICQNLGGMVLVGQTVPHGAICIFCKIFHNFLTEAAIFDAVKHA